MMEAVKTRPFHQRAAWIAAITGALLLVPLGVTWVSEEVEWSLGDFLVAGCLLFGAGLAHELMGRQASGRLSYRLGSALAVVGCLLLVWMNLAVGLIGTAGHPANLLYGAVLLAVIGGSVAVGFRARGMALTMLAAAVVQSGLAVLAVSLKLGAEESGPAEILLINGVFVALFVGSAALFNRAS
jgi:hypothetical protein